MVFLEGGWGWQSVSRGRLRVGADPAVGFGFGVEVSGLGLRVEGLGFRVQGFGSRVQGLGFTPGPLDL